MIQEQFYPGMWLKSYAHGQIVVKKVYMHADTGETCLDCKSEQGDNLHISLAYARILLDR